MWTQASLNLGPEFLTSMLYAKYKEDQTLRSKGKLYGEPNYDQGFLPCVEQKK